MEHDLAAHALGHKAGEKPVMMPEMHMKKMHSGGFHITKHHEDGTTTEHAAKSVNAMKEHMMEHFQPEEQGEGAEPEAQEVE